MFSIEVSLTRKKNVTGRLNVHSNVYVQNYLFVTDDRARCGCWITTIKSTNDKLEMTAYFVRFVIICHIGYN